MTQILNPVVLMYHGIITTPDSIPNNREAGAALYDVRLEDFRKQMEFLKNNSCDVQALETENKSSAGSKTKVILTFDDGEINNFHNAFPVLQDYGFAAYFFVTVNRVGKKGYMGWDELKELRDANMIIGSHSLNHEILTNLKESQVEGDLTQSKEILERNLKVNVDSFSVPRGFYNQKILEMAWRVGYKNVFVSGIPDVETPGCIGRVAVKADWSLMRFNQALCQQVPLSEKAGEHLKNFAKKFLGGQIYNDLRTTLLKK